MSDGNITRTRPGSAEDDVSGIVAQDLGSPSTRPRVLIESHDLTLPNGTGIATYVRGLAAAARASNFRPLALYEVDRPLPRNPALQEVRLSDAFESRHDLSLKLRTNLRWFVGAPFGMSATPLHRQGIVLNPVRDKKFAAFEETHVAPKLFSLARRTFNVYKSFLDVKLENPPDIFHASRPVQLRVRGRPNIYTVHDLVPLRLPHTTLDNKQVFYKTMAEIARTADHIVTVSEFSKEDICQLFSVDPKRVTNTYQAVHFSPLELSMTDEDVEGELQAAFNLRSGEYYIFLGALEPKKNVGRLIEAYLGVDTRRPLVISGGAGWLNQQDLAAINDESLTSYRVEGRRIVRDRRVLRIPYVSRSRLISLMRGARALLFPSLYEGFGLPVLEAMTLGTPVLTSNVSSLPEVAGDAAILVDPYDVSDIARGIRRLENDGDLLAELSRRGLRHVDLFSPERCRERVEKLYSSLL